MRKTCFECVLKHLGSAAIYIEEYYMGYPNYIGYIIGELTHASSECLHYNSPLARIIREHRINWMKKRYTGDRYLIPFDALFRYIDDQLSLEEDAILEIPEDILVGLDKDKDGNVIFSNDTRP